MMVYKNNHNKSKCIITQDTSTKSIKQIKEMEKKVVNDKKKFNITYFEYKKFKYSIENKSLTLNFCF